MAYNLLTLNREQSYLMPPSLWEWLDEGDLAWFILDAVDQMDLGEFYAAYRNDGWGAAAYAPAMVVGVLFYAYCQGIRSSRRIARSSGERGGLSGSGSQSAAGLPDHLSLSVRAREGSVESLCASTLAVSGGWPGEVGGGSSGRGKVAANAAFEANLTACSGPGGPELVIATTKDWKQRKAARERRCPPRAHPQRLEPT